jgi:uncharacterized membrane protein
MKKYSAGIFFWSVLIGLLFGLPAVSAAGEADQLGLEHALEQEGFLLKHSFLHHIARHLVYYCEDTARHNMEIRGHVTKKNEKEVFIGVHEQHVRPDLAGKSPELREYE